MRIIAGKHRRRTLFTPDDDSIRPTSDRVRQAVFNILNARGLVIDAVVIDAFCGTGALGLEALSQGAQYVSFFDKSKKSVQLCQKNIELLGEQDNSQLKAMDVTQVGQCPNGDLSASLIFLDPPYHKNLVSPSIYALVKQGWVCDRAYFLIETSKQESISCPLIEIEHEKDYGDTKITLATLK